MARGGSAKWRQRNRPKERFGPTPFRVENDSLDEPIVRGWVPVETLKIERQGQK